MFHAVKEGPTIVPLIAVATEPLVARTELLKLLTGGVV
jgi:hypothetical protein